MPAETAYSLPHNLFSVPDIHPEVNRDAISGHGNIQVFLYPFHSPFEAHELIAVANALVNSRGKGVYATDESPDAMDVLLNAVTPDGLKKHLTGAENTERRKKWKESMYNAVPSGNVQYNATVKKPLIRRRIYIWRYSPRRNAP